METAFLCGPALACGAARDLDTSFARRTALPRRVRRRTATPRLSCCVRSDEGTLGGALARGARTLSLAAAIALGAGVSPALARSRDMQLTDQVASFTLPSREADASGTRGEPLHTRALRVARKGAPPVIGVAVAAWAIVRIVRSAQRRRLRDFQSQLQSLSTMLSLDASALDGSVPTPAVRPRTDERRYRRRDETAVADEVVAAAETNVRLDLFRAAGAPTPDAAPGASARPADVAPDGAFEAAAAACLAEVGAAIGERSAVGDAFDATAEAARVKAAVDALDAAAKAQALASEDAVAALCGYASRVVSMHVDRAATHLDSDDRESLRNLHALASTMGASALISREQGRTTSGLRYVGRHGGAPGLREELYRRYAVFCLSSEERMRDDLQGLADMQSLLAVSDSRAETINKEIAKGMFQVAVSAAMADGGLDDSGRDAIEKLRVAFGGFLEGGDADAIMSEVAVMRAMYALQQLLADSGVDDEDVRRLRDMCRDLGVDIDEMMKNADALGSVLGPEAKQFVESLSDILQEAEGGVAGDSVLTTATPVDVTPAPASALPGGDAKASATVKPATAAKGPPESPSTTGGKDE